MTRRNDFMKELDELLKSERDDHNPLTQIKIGKLYQSHMVDGETDESSWENALAWFSKAMEQNCPEGFYFVASCYDMDADESRKNPELSFSLYSKAFELGVVQAGVEIGRCYANGYGTEKDEKKALEYYLKAAGRGIPSSFRLVAECFLFGKGTERNPLEAKKWYEKLVKHDYSSYGIFPTGDDYLFLGIACKLSAENKASFKKAFEYFQKSAAEGNPNGINEVGECYFYGIGVKEDNNKAFEMFKKSADKDCAFAYKNLGHCYSKGFGVKENKGKAFSCFKKSFDMGNEQASLELAICYNQGEGVEEDLDIAFAYFSRAKKLGLPESWWWLGKCYEYGDGCKQDFKKAFSYYKKSMELGDPKGYVAVGECYIAGLGTKKDFSKGWGIIQTQAKSGNEIAQDWLVENYDGGAPHKEPLDCVGLDEREA